MLIHLFRTPSTRVAPIKKCNGTLAAPIQHSLSLDVFVVGCEEAELSNSSHHTPKNCINYTVSSFGTSTLHCHSDSLILPLSLSTLTPSLSLIQGVQTLTVLAVLPNPSHLLKYFNYSLRY